MEFKECGNPCLPTCSDPEGMNCGRIEHCEEGCFCKEGMIFDGEGKCLAAAQCGCEVPEQNVYVNVRYLSGCLFHLSRIAILYYRSILK